MHKSVLLQEAVEWLAPRPGGLYVDGTLGLGGHSEAILKAASGKARLLGFDLDRDALARAGERLRDFSGSTEFVHANFEEVPDRLEKADLCADGILLDLGVNSLQFDLPERGFSFREEGPLDMRMNRAQARTAADLLENLPEEELERIFREYGEERFARKVARAIVRDRPRRFETTKDLADYVCRLLRRRGRIHPATRIFQALRIAVNRELESLKNFLQRFDKSLCGGGRLVVISFHSLEDRMVKWSFRGKADEGVGNVLTKKPLRPSFEEVSENPRARSAKLRVFEKAVDRESGAELALE